MDELSNIKFFVRCYHVLIKILIFLENQMMFTVSDFYVWYLIMPFFSTVDYKSKYGDDDDSFYIVVYGKMWVTPFIVLWSTMKLVITKKYWLESTFLFIHLWVLGWMDGLMYEWMDRWIDR